jgi:poly(hydroxyalkanoate) granule-associated protein
MAIEEEKIVDGVDQDGMGSNSNETVVECANLYLRVRKYLLTSLGAVALTTDEAGEFIDKLVERGEVAEADLKKMMEELQARRQARQAEVQQMRQDVLKKSSVRMEESVESILDRLNVPSRRDIEELSKKISELDKKVSDLKQKRQQQTSGED